MTYRILSLRCIRTRRSRGSSLTGGVVPFCQQSQDAILSSNFLPTKIYCEWDKFHSSVQLKMFQIFTTGCNVSRLVVPNLATPFQAYNFHTTRVSYRASCVTVWPLSLYSSTRVDHLYYPLVIPVPEIYLACSAPDIHTYELGTQYVFMNTSYGDVGELLCKLCEKGRCPSWVISGCSSNFTSNFDPSINFPRTSDCRRMDAS